MTTIAEVDSKAAVSKFISRDTSVQGTIEAIATSFLLDPQIPLIFILKARNQLQTLIATQIKLINKILFALDYVVIPETTINNKEQLVNAKVALIQLDQLGRVTSGNLENYQTSIDTFIKKSLSKTKSGITDTFGLSQTEAREDIYIGLAGFTYYHNKIIELIASLCTSIDNFEQANIQNIVSRRVISNIKASVIDVINNVDSLSRISVLLELLAGKAALSSITFPRKLSDPLIDSGIFPPSTFIQVYSDKVPAIATSFTLPMGALSTSFSMSVDGGAMVTLDYPRTGATGTCFIISKLTLATVTIPANSSLYIKVFYNAPMVGPNSIVQDVIQIPLTAGNRTFTQVMTEIDSGLSVLDVNGGTTRYGNCTHFAKNNSNILMIYGASNVTNLQVVGLFIGTYNNNVYTYPRLSAHDILGFDFDQLGINANQITASELSRFISINYVGCATTVLDNKVIINSLSTDTTSKLEFNNMAVQVGFPLTNSPAPNLLITTNNRTLTDISQYDVYSGCTLKLGEDTYSILEINGPFIKLNEDVPPIPISSIKIYSDIYLTIAGIIKNIIPYTNEFNSDIFRVQQALTPIITSTPSIVQTSSSKKVLSTILTNLQNFYSILDSYKIDEPKSKSVEIAKEIIYILESRNMNNMINMLLGCKFKEFFETSIDNVSSGTMLLSTVENIGRTDLILPKV